MKWRFHYLNKQTNNNKHTWKKQYYSDTYVVTKKKKQTHDFELLYIEAKLLQLRRQNIQWKQKLKEANNSKYLDQQNQIQ